MKKLITTLLCAAFCGAQVLFSTEVKFVDYVETDGTQAIDTGFFVTPQTRITADFAYTDTTKQQRVFGAASDFDAPALSCALYINGNSLYAWAMCNGKGNWTSTGVTADTNRHLFVLDSVNNQYVLATGAVTNKTGALGTTRTKTAVWPLAIFANRNSESLEFNVYGKVRLYGFIIETNSVENGWIKVMDLKPVSIGESGGLYDLVSGEIFRSATTTPLTASPTAPQMASVAYQAVTAEGTMDFQVAVDGKYVPCTLTAVVSNTVTGVTTTKPLGTVEDSDVHAYQLSDLSPDGKYVVAIRGTWPGAADATYETDLATMTVRPPVIRAMTLRDSLAIRFAGITSDNRLRMAYGAAAAGDDPNDWDATADCETPQTDEGFQRIPFPEGWGDTVHAARLFLTNGDEPGVAAWSETVVPEDKSFSSLCYVTNGLIAQWDAIENAGRGVHSDKPASWTELVGGVTVSKSANLTYGKNAVTFDGSKERYFTCNLSALKTALANKSCTVEMQLRPTEYVKYGGIFQVGSSTARELILDQREESGSGSAKCAFGGLQYAASGWASATDCCPPANDYFGKDVMATVTVDADGAHLAYDGGEIVHTNPGKGVAPTSDLLTVGLYGGNSPAKMSVRSIRIYDTALTRGQSQWNLFVDRVRFCTQSDFCYSKDQGSLTFSMDCQSSVPYDVIAIVRDVGETWTTVTNVVAEGVVSGPVSVNIPGVDPTGSYEIVVRILATVDGKEVETDVNVLSMVAPTSVKTPGTIYQTAAAASLDNPEDWLLPASALRRTPLDGDKVIIGQTAGTYTLNITNTRTFNGWSGAGAANVVSETTIGAGSTLNITNTTAYSGNKSGSKASFVVDGGTLHIKVNAQDSMYGTDTLTIKNGGTFLRDGAKDQTHSVVMAGTSRIYLQDGTFTITPASGQAPYNTLHFSGGGTPAFIQTGGTASCGSLSFQQQSDNYYEISGGSMTLSGANGGVKHGNRSGSTATCGTLRMRGSKFTFAAQDIGYAYSSSSRTLLPTFFDYRIRSDADPGAKGVGFIDYTATAVKGAIRAIPDGGVAIVHTNLFPLIVQRSKKSLTFANDFKDNMASYRFMPTGLFDIGVPSGLAYMIRADLKPEAELADGWTSEEGVSAGFVKLPCVHTPAKLLKADLKLKVEPQGTKTLDSLKSDLEAMGFGPVTADETAAYNLVVGLPKDRIAKNFADSKVIMDFTTVTGAKAMQSNKVTTNALIKAVSFDIRKPGLVLFAL